MYYHVGEWSRVIVRDYRHHPLVSIFTSALMIPLSLSTTCTPSRPRAGLSTSTGLFLHPLHLIALLSWSPFFHALLNIPIWLICDVRTKEDRICFWHVSYLVPRGYLHYPSNWFPADMAQWQGTQIHRKPVIHVLCPHFESTTRIIFIDKIMTHRACRRLWEIISCLHHHHDYVKI
jgi:hypothetical protein